MYTYLCIYTNRNTPPSPGISMIKLWFTSFWDGFNADRFFICRILRTHRIKYQLCESDPDIVIYSIFGYVNRRTYPTSRLFIFYTAESVLDHPEADIVIGFHPPMGNITDRIKRKRFIQIRNYERIEIEQFDNWLPYQSLREGECLPLEPPLGGRIREDSGAESGVELPPRLHPKRGKLRGEAHPLRGFEGEELPFCAFIVSNPGSWQRNTFFELLSRYRKVDSLGQYKRNVDFVVPGRHYAAYLQLLGTYKFIICFENCSVKYYLTEKLYNTMKAGPVPIYWGDPTVSDMFNVDQSMIYIPTSTESDAEQIRLFRLAIERIIVLDNDEKQYQCMRDTEYQTDHQARKYDERFSESVDELINHFQ